MSTYSHIARAAEQARRLTIGLCQLAQAARHENLRAIGRNCERAARLAQKTMDRIVHIVDEYNLGDYLYGIFTVSERHTLWLRAISIRTSGMIPMSCKMNTTNGRPVSLDGRIAMSKPSSGSFIRWVLDGFTMFSPTHRNTAIIPASRVYAEAQLASLVGVATTTGSRAPTRRARAVSGAPSGIGPDAPDVLGAGLKPLAGTHPSRTCFGWHGRWASRSPNCLGPWASVPSGPVYDKAVYHSQSRSQTPPAIAGKRFATRQGECALRALIS